MKNSILPAMKGTARWKDVVRLRGVPFAASIGNKLGFAWPALGKRLGRENLIAQARHFPRRHTVPAADKPLEIVFLTMLGGHTLEVATEAALGLALQARGHHVRFVVCDKLLPICENKKRGQEPDWDRLCAKCWGFGQDFLQGFGFEIIPLSRLVKKKPLQADAYPDIVEAALLKHYQVGVLAGLPDVETRKSLLSQAAALSAAAGHALVDMRVDRVIMSHGIYCTWGPARDVLNAAGIDVLTYGPGKKRLTQKFNWTTSADWWDVSEEWDRVKNTPLTPLQEERITRYLDSRRTHSQDGLIYNFGDEEDLEHTRARLRLDPDKQTFVLYTNVLWDAASTQREIAFRNPVEWVFDTIAWFTDRPTKQLVVKIHPAEVVIGTRQPFASLIKERFPNLPDNVRIVEPHEKVNSWSIYRIADLGLVHTSTVGMEMQLLGIPCAVVSHTHFRSRGFTIDINAREEYFDLLESWSADRVDRENLRTLALRYAYLLFERYQLPFDILYETSYSDVRAFNFNTINELMASKSVELIVKSIETRGSFLLPE